jgi:hypothetical protein
MINLGQGNLNSGTRLFIELSVISAVLSVVTELIVVLCVDYFQLFLKFQTYLNIDFCNRLSVNLFMKILMMTHKISNMRYFSFS